MINTETKESFIRSNREEPQSELTTKKRSRPTKPGQRLAYLRRWEASGLSAEAFAASRPINAQSLYRWRMLEKSGKLEEAKLVASPFAELKLPLASHGETVEGASIVLKSARLEATIRGRELSGPLRDILEAMGKDASDV